ncbi:hypothetical protein NVP1170O_127 [Vibrio phage 1.170.O._10N.261.52.C3]|nr:hypothetical protein NVP1170O_127 [Vibrio phage 1.170.O._10N.261.52.C3]
MNSITLVQLYLDFCKEGLVKGSLDGFIKMCDNPVMFTVFVGYCIKEGYSSDKVEEYFNESETDPNRTFSELVEAFGKIS